VIRGRKYKERETQAVKKRLYVKAETFCHHIDVINERVAKTVVWLFIPFAFLIGVDVFTRYVLNKPWYYIDINVQLMGTLVILGSGYCLLHQGHIGVDVLVARFSSRKRAILDLILSPAFFLCLCVLLWKTGDAAWDSLRLLERSSSSFAPPIFPYKNIIVVGIILLFLQGIAKFIRDLIIVMAPQMRGKQ